MSAILDRETMERLRALPPREAFRDVTDAVYRAGAVSSDDFLDVYEQMVEENFLSERQAPTPESVVMDGVLDGEIQEAMAELPEEYRTVVVMALVDEMSYKEIATALTIPLGTVMSRLHRGRKLLQAALLEFARRKGIVKGPRSVAPDGDQPS